MRISAKGRYGIAALVYLVGKKAEYVPIISVSKELGISKIYLEQIFSTLRKSGILESWKGSQGGYRLAKPAREITLYDILSVLELTLFEKTESSCSDAKPAYEATIQKRVYDELDRVVRDKLSSITLRDLADDIQVSELGGNFMYYI